MTINFNTIQAARENLAGVITPTPVLRDTWLSLELGANIHHKAECLQRSGSFKLRGAYTKILTLSPQEKKRGVIAPSAGNHAQGVALAAQLHGIQCTIVMPTFAPLTKVEATKAYGATVLLEGSSFDDAAAHAQDLATQHGFVYVHAFNDEAVIAGQGSIGLEILEALPEIDTIVVPIGGGGLISGITLAAKTLNPKVRVVGVQAEGCASVRPSLKAGRPVAAQVVQTIADGIAVKRPGELTLPIIRDWVDEIVEVSDDEIARGIVHGVQRTKLVVEGAGAAGLAAILAGKVSIAEHQTVCNILCGGNIDGNLLSRVIDQVLVRQGRYVMLKITVVDRPGSLAQLIDRVAETQANIIDVYHRRALWLAPLGKVGVELVLEVRNETHGQAVMEHLTQHGYHVEREGLGAWPE